MRVQIILEQPYSVFTNLDFVRGLVVLNLSNPTNITTISVKLQGESRTKLITPVRDASERTSIKEEAHKILYKVQQVFPSNAATSASPLAYPQRHFTLNPGQYEYPFEFKIPFNNSCSDGNAFTSLGSNLLRNDAPTRHRKGALPPTLTSFPGLAEIRYYVKVTVNRKEFYRENPRTIQFFNFLPIEPPGPPATSLETFARRQHCFPESSSSRPPQPSSKLMSILSRHSKSSNLSSSMSVDLPVFNIDVRLPSPPILTCNETLPLRIVLKHLNNSPEVLYLQSLQIQLLGHTRIFAKDILRDETNVWMIVSYNAMAIPLPHGNTKAGQVDEEFVLDNQPWKNIPLPTSVAPSFQTCNIARKYELLIQVGIGYGRYFTNNTVVLPLRHPVEVYSGIKPPAALLAAVSSASPLRRPPNHGTQDNNDAVSESSKHTATTHPSRTKFPDVSGDRIHVAQAASGDDEEEPPPSYEDTIAQSLPPIDGQRRAYEPPPVRSSDGFGIDGDE